PRRLVAEDQRVAEGAWKPLLELVNQGARPRLGLDDGLRSRGSGLRRGRGRLWRSRARRRRSCRRLRGRSRPVRWHFGFVTHSVLMLLLATRRSRREAPATF